MMTIAGTLTRTAASLLVVAGAVTTSPELGAQAAVTLTNWREVKTLKFGRFQTRIEVSSLRTLRLISDGEKAVLMSAELRPDSLRAWHNRVLLEFDKPSSTKYVFDNSILLEPHNLEGSLGYALTLADTNGVARTFIMDTGGLVDFLDLVLTGVMAAIRLTNADLQRAGPVTETPVSLAKSVSAVYPRNAQLAGVSGKALVQFVVDTTGRAKPETINCLEATFKDFADAAVGTVKTMVFNPATLEGHKIERLVQYPFEFNLNAVLPIKPFPIPTRRGR
jgi:TonB family protein